MSKKSVWLFGCFVVLLGARTPVVSAADFAAKYKDRLVILRIPACGQELKFDATANLLSGAVRGNWTECIGIRIHDVQVQDGNVKIKAQRVRVFYDCGTMQFRDVKKAGGDSSTTESDQVSIELQLRPPADESVALDLMDRLFRASNADLRVPGSIYRVGNGVSAPAPIYTPDPDYTDEALKASYHGTVVLVVVIGPDGLIQDASVVRATSAGLDEKAVGKVMTWRFKPAALCGIPVAVEVNIEVTLNLGRQH